MTRADLKHCGKIPDPRDELYRSVIEWRRQSRHSIKSLEGLGSSSHDLGAEIRMHSFTVNCDTFSNEEKKSAALRPLLDQHRLACLSSATQPNSGAWIKCLLSTAVGTLLDNESSRIAISQHLGVPVCAPHKCRCGAIVHRYGLHPLSCRFSAGRLPRHSALNDIIKRALSSTGFNAVLEPVGHDRGDGKRPDSTTVLPFSIGRCLIWDCTCVNYFPPQHWL